MITLGVIGGSGLYRMAGVEDLREESLSTPFGEPSDSYMLGTLGGRSVAFLARHGRGHRLLPSEINYRANIYGFKALGVERLVSVSAVGSMKEALRPLDVALPAQYIDRTRLRPSTFFGAGIAAHISLADPFCPALTASLAEAGEHCGARMHHGATYLCVEGPQFSTRAESRLFRSWGVDVIGMTNVPEVKLAREAEICYATLAMVTDYDCWHADETPVTVEQVVGRLKSNASTAHGILGHLIGTLTESRPCGCGSALRDAILTDPSCITREVRDRLHLLVGKYLD